MIPVLTSLQKQILEYVRSNVNAAETAKGVNDVWLKCLPTARSVNGVEQALDGLVQLRLMEKHSLPGGVNVYRLAGRAPDP